MKGKYFNDFAQANFTATFSEIASYSNSNVLAMKLAESRIQNEHIG